MATATKVSLTNVTLSSNSTSITFGSISQSYTDLVLVMNLKRASGMDYCGIRFNSDTGTNYSDTELYGTGSTATSRRDSNTTSAYTGLFNNLNFTPIIVNLNNYSNASTNKTFLSRYSVADTTGYAGYQAVGSIVGLWRSTSAITSFTLIDNSGFVTGSTFNLYGIL